MTNSSAPVQEYWLPGYELSRYIVLRQIQYFLGPKATIRPYSLQGREGYLIVGVPLTKDQIDDLKRQSKEYERQQAIRMKTRRTGSEAQDQDADISGIVVVGAARRPQQQQQHTSHRRSTHREAR